MMMVRQNLACFEHFKNNFYRGTYFKKIIFEIRKNAIVK